MSTSTDPTTFDGNRVIVAQALVLDRAPAVAVPA